MALKQHDRQYDVVVFGATGYTGKLIAQYITINFPTDFKWAVAGRSESKLADLVADCQHLNTDRLQPGVETASVDDEATIRALAQKTFILITTVGPFAKYGEPAFKACAELGTHYIDVTGEMAWTVKMIRAYEKTANASGAIMLPQIGLESAPPDLCTWMMAKCLRTQLGAKMRETYVTMHLIDSAPSGGTLASVLTLFDLFTVQEIAEASSPYCVSPIPHKEPSRPARSISQRLLGIHTIPNLGMVTTSVSCVSDISSVERSWGLLHELPDRKDEFYGPNFVWMEYFKTRNWFQGIALHWFLTIGGFILAMLPPIRSLLKKLITQPGQGPDLEDARKDRVEYRGTSNPDTETPTGKQAFCRATFNGSIYAIFASEAAKVLLTDETGLDGGIYTAACLGDPFIDRIDAAGFKIETKLLDV